MPPFQNNMANNSEIQGSTKGPQNDAFKKVLCFLRGLELHKPPNTNYYLSVNY